MDLPANIHMQAKVIDGREWVYLPAEIVIDHIPLQTANP
jgi:hypothetical protein